MIYLFIAIIVQLLILGLMQIAMHRELIEAISRVSFDAPAYSQDSSSVANEMRKLNDQLSRKRDAVKPEITVFNSAVKE